MICGARAICGIQRPTVCRVGHISKRERDALVFNEARNEARTSGWIVRSFYLTEDTIVTCKNKLDIEMQCTVYEEMLFISRFENRSKNLEIEIKSK